MRRTAWRPARRNRADALDRLRRRCASSPRRCALAFASACHGARTRGERTPRVTIGGRHHRCTVSSRVGLVCGQAVRRNAGFEPALPASRAGALPTELIPGRLGAHKTLGTHRAMGSVSAPDGLKNPNHGTPHAAQPPSGGFPRRRSDDCDRPRRRFSIRFLRSKKSPVRQSDQGFFGAWKDALRIASRKSWKVSACSPRRFGQARGRSATGRPAATAMPSAAGS